MESEIYLKEGHYNVTSEVEVEINQIYTKDKIYYIGPKFHITYFLFIKEEANLLQ